MSSPYQILPNLTADEVDALRADIQARGVQVAVELDELGNILDGHHRVVIAGELGIEYPKVIREGWTEEQKVVHVLALNLARRQLTTEQREEVIREMHERFPEMSDRALARATKVPRSTVRRKRRRDIHVGQTVHVNTELPPVVVGLDGKAYQSSATREEEEAQAREMAARGMYQRDIAQELGRSQSTINRYLRGPDTKKHRSPKSTALVRDFTDSSAHLDRLRTLRDLIRVMRKEGAAPYASAIADRVDEWIKWLQDDGRFMGEIAHLIARRGERSA